MENYITSIPLFNRNKIKILLSLFLPLIFSLSPLYAQQSTITAREFSDTLPASEARDPININIIIDSSKSLSNVKDDVDRWISSRLDEILALGDRVTVWNAGERAGIIYSDRVNGETEKEALKAAIREITPSSVNTADFSGALKEASGRNTNGGAYSYTLLINASFETLTAVLSGPDAGLLRFSRVEEFSAWRTLVVGLNIDARVRNAAAAFFNN